jgi:hypothetical protein
MTNLFFATVDGPRIGSFRCVLPVRARARLALPQRLHTRQYRDLDAVCPLRLGHVMRDFNAGISGMVCTR